MDANFIRRHMLGKEQIEEPREVLLARLRDAEISRLNLIANRDGVPAALEFANRVYSTYRTALIGKAPHYAKTIVFRTAFVVSCVVLRRFIRNNKGNNNVSH